MSVGGNVDVYKYIYGYIYVRNTYVSNSKRMQQANDTTEKEVARGELESMVMEEDYLYETMDAAGGAHGERSQTTTDDGYSDGPPVCEVYGTIDESGSINPCKCEV